MRSSDNGRVKILLKIMVTTGIIFLILLCIMFFLIFTQKPKELQISNIDIATISNGTYIGSADNGLVKATVSVEVNNGVVQYITIVEHEHLLGKSAEKILDSIVDQQSLEVDAISSATYSSDTLRKAVENALRQGEKN